jgi:hypothetical protein
LTETNAQGVSLSLRFFGPIVGVIGRSSDRLQIAEKEETTIRDVIVTLCDRYGDNFKVIALKNDGEINPGLIVFVNGSHVIDLSHKLTPLDEVQMMIASQMKGG